MGAIKAYKTNEAGPDLQRQKGMERLGKLIIANTSNITEKAGKAHESEFVDGLFAALESIHNELHYKLAFSYQAAGGAANVEVDITSLTKGTKKIDCDLHGGGSVELKVKAEDTRNGNKFKMDVVFPEPTDIASYTYLILSAQDTCSFPTPAEKQNYLAAFKFLSRCA